MSYSLVLPFDTDHSEFVRGFEAGRLWEVIRADASTIEQTIHATNAEMVMRMCEAEDRSFCAEQLDEMWMSVVIE